MSQFISLPSGGEVKVYIDTEAPGNDTTIVLSERNLLSLLDKLYWEDSACTIECGDFIFRLHEDGPQRIEGMKLQVKAEHDVDHYADRLPDLPGRMHHKTEAALNKIKEAHSRA